MENFQEAFDRLSKTGWKVRGSGLKAISFYVRQKEKEETVLKIEERLALYGYPIKLKTLRPLQWYPIALSAALLFSVSEVLSWGEKEMREMGQAEPKVAFLISYLSKYLISPRRAYRAAAIFWRKTYNFGELETPEFNEKERYGILRIKNFDLHPFFCRYLEGYIETGSRLVIRGANNVWCREEKCTFRGDLFHEFITRWE